MSRLTDEERIQALIYAPTTSPLYWQALDEHLERIRRKIGCEHPNGYYLDDADEVYRCLDCTRIISPEEWDYKHEEKAGESYGNTQKQSP